MTPEERLLADYRGSELTIGPHPMAWRRAELDRLGATRAADLARTPNGRRVRLAGRSSSDSARERPRVFCSESGR